MPRVEIEEGTGEPLAFVDVDGDGVVAAIGDDEGSRFGWISVAAAEDAEEEGVVSHCEVSAKSKVPGPVWRMWNVCHSIPVGVGEGFGAEGAPTVPRATRGVVGGFSDKRRRRGRLTWMTNWGTHGDFVRFGQGRPGRSFCVRKFRAEMLTKRGWRGWLRAREGFAVERPEMRDFVDA